MEKLRSVFTFGFLLLAIYFVNYIYQNVKNKRYNEKQNIQAYIQLKDQLPRESVWEYQKRESEDGKIYTHFFGVISTNENLDYYKDINVYKQYFSDISFQVNPDGFTNEGETVLFTLLCTKNQSQFIIQWPRIHTRGETTVPVLTRVDNQLPQLKNWLRADDWSTTLLNSSARNDLFLEALLFANNLNLTVFPTDKPALSYDFDIRGFENHRKKIKEVCNFTSL